MPNAYEVLGVPRDAAQAEISTAYHRRSLKLHPDKAPESDKARATERWTAFYNAIEPILDPERRRIYDVKLRRAEIEARQRSNSRASELHASARPRTQSTSEPAAPGQGWSRESPGYRPPSRVAPDPSTLSRPQPQARPSSNIYGSGSGRHGSSSTSSGGQPGRHSGFADRPASAASFGPTASDGQRFGDRPGTSLRRDPEPVYERTIYTETTRVRGDGSFDRETTRRRSTVDESGMVHEHWRRTRSVMSMGTSPQPSYQQARPPTAGGYRPMSSAPSGNGFGQSPSFFSSPSSQRRASFSGGAAPFSSSSSSQTYGGTRPASRNATY